MEPNTDTVHTLILIVASTSGTGSLHTGQTGETETALQNNFLYKSYNNYTCNKSSYAISPHLDHPMY
jgi:hypothetical protein